MITKVTGWLDEDDEGVSRLRERIINYHLIVVQGQEGCSITFFNNFVGTCQDEIITVIGDHLTFFSP